MKKILSLTLAIFLPLLSSCEVLDNQEESSDELIENITGESINDKKRIEVRFSCEEDDIEKYIKNGWNILEESSEEKICTWQSFPATKDCDMEKDKGCKITKPDKIGEEKIYLLEK